MFGVCYGQEFVLLPKYWKMKGEDLMMELNKPLIIIHLVANMNA